MGPGNTVKQKQINVLVVDDEPSIREVIRFALGKSGFAVQCAVSGQDTLAKIQ